MKQRLYNSKPPHIQHKIQYKNNTNKVIPEQQYSCSTYRKKQLLVYN